MAITVPVPRLSGPRVRRTVRELGTWLGRIARPARAPLRNLASSPLTALGFACIDACVFMWSARVGLGVTGVSLIVLEHIIADEE